MIWQPTERLPRDWVIMKISHNNAKYKNYDKKLTVHLSCSRELDKKMWVHLCLEGGKNITCDYLLKIQDIFLDTTLVTLHVVSKKTQNFYQCLDYCPIPSRFKWTQDCTKE